MYYEMKTKRLLLRPLNISDIDTVYEYSSDEENTRFMIHLPSKSVDETAFFLNAVTSEWEKEAPSFYEFAVVLDGRQIGAVSVYLNEDGDSGELGWIINKRYLRKGLASEAAFTLKDFALHHLKLKKLVAHCDCRNVASYSLMRKIGMVREDIVGTRTYSRSGETVNEYIYSLSADE